MQTYYLDMKDGVPIRDRSDWNSTELTGNEHSKQIAGRFSHEHQATNDKLHIIVLNAGNEIHREQFNRPLFKSFAAETKSLQPKLCR